MQDIIQLLPDHISNQIAAGEVIQRPSSAVKELIENSLDAKATKIVLILKDAGKTLIQVNDNGIGMSRTDARLCFEKHATSKIKDIDDLFRIRSNGFRGEALASIAAVSQVDMKSKRAIDDAGTRICIEDSKVISQEPISMPEGTQILMKNLFFNVPARRNFLKSDAIEMTHNIAEFSRLAIAYPEVEFQLYHNDIELYRLPSAPQLKRIVDVLGKNLNDKLIPVKEESDIVRIQGYVCKPDVASSRTKSRQYLYVNKRFIRSNYIQHAIISGYRELLNQGDFPYYVIFIDLDPKSIDINVHPTKQEIKFEDEQLIYGFVQAATRRALMQYNLAPSLDFQIDPIFNNLDAVVNPNKQNSQTVFVENGSSVRNGRSGFEFVKQNEQNWQQLFSQSLQQESYTSEIERIHNESNQEVFPESLIGNTLVLLTQAIQIRHKYILASTQIGLLVIDQTRALERVLFDEMIAKSAKSVLSSQRLLFPVTIELSMQDSFVLEELGEDLHHLGFDLSSMGSQVFAIHGLPSELSSGGEKEVIQDLIENFKNNYKANKSKKEVILNSICKLVSHKKAQILSIEESTHLANRLFECENPHTTFDAKPIYLRYDYAQIDQYFT